MMDRWDQATPLYRAVHSLARVRRENPAVQRGFHHARLLTTDTYVFERAWGDSVCLAAFNRGAARSVGPIPTALPDGTHRCVLSDRAVTVRDHRIESLQLEADDSLVLSHAVPEPAPQGTRVTFQLNGYATAFGERVAVIGSASELGEWDLAKAVPLRYVNPNLWEGDVDFTMSAGQVVRVKFVVLRDGGEPTYEAARPRHVYIPPQGRALKTERWNG